ncbi:MAG: class I SAM-dependent RNA methyltransferase [Eubacteriaceae bacterium]|nr:class I SAM-dependent RNA methyltransferase [Eubacteriaceae bacterium]
MKIFATCAFGTESVLKREMTDLGYDIVSSRDGLLGISGGASDALRLNLSLRSANRVLIGMGSFPAKSFDELFDAVYAIAWEEMIPPDGRFNVEKITSVSSALFSKSDCQRIIKKAAAERLKKAHRKSVLPESGANYPIYVQIKKDIVDIYLNSSGEGLNRRGYRLNKGEAPLMETLAAAMVLLSGRRADEDMADIFCGSGTIAIEAAMIATDTPPGINRSFAMEEWFPDERKSFASLREELRCRIHPPGSGRILASDIDGSQIANAIKNAERAGVKEHIAFQKMDFRSFSSSRSRGIIITNPPYGERIMDRKETEGLYRDMGKLMERLPGWMMEVICANPDFQRCFGRKADRNRKLYNGNMLSYLYTYRPERTPKGGDINE